MGKASTERPLSYDSYPLTMHYLAEMERKGLGMFVQTPEGHGSIWLNRNAEFNDMPTANKKVAKYVLKYNLPFKLIREEPGTLNLYQIAFIKANPGTVINPVPRRMGIIYRIYKV